MAALTDVPSALVTIGHKLVVAGIHDGYRESWHVIKIF